MTTRRLRSLRARRGVETVVYLGVIGGLLFGSGWLLGGLALAVWALVLAAAALMVGLRVPVGVTLRLRSAAPVSPRSAFELRRLVAGLASRAGLAEPPQLYYLPTAVPQAFAVASTGEAAIAVTRGLLQRLTGRELAGVLAHEMSHLASGDTKVMALARAMRHLTRTLALLGALLFIANAFSVLFGGEPVSPWPVLLLMVTPTVATLAELGLSRTRELDADLAAAALTNDPRGLASALSKVEAFERGLLERLLPRAATKTLPAWLRSHPDTEERVRRLLELTPPVPPRGPAAPGGSGPRVIRVA